MHYYKFDDKAMDIDFLNSKVVSCKVIDVKKNASSVSIQTGDAITIALTTGAKYKGTIISFKHFMVGEYAVGEIEVAKAS